MLAEQRGGDYRFLAAPGRPFSGGAVADTGFTVVHALFARPLPLHPGLEVAVDHVRAAGRPVQALCGFELRIPEPLSQSGFDAFNAGYVERLQELGVVTPDGLLPGARTNVAPATETPVAEPSVFGFSYTVPGDGPGWVLSGAPEPSPGLVAEMLAGVVDVLGARLAELGAAWDEATGVNLYAEEPVADALVAVLPAAGLVGVRWYPSLPPIDSLRVEVDARAAAQELRVWELRV